VQLQRANSEITTLLRDKNKVRGCSVLVWYFGEVWGLERQLCSKLFHLQGVQAPTHAICVCHTAERLLS
jgi:hypothetical protein